MANFFKLDGYMAPLSADGYSDALLVGDAAQVAVQFDVSTSDAVDGYCSLQAKANGNGSDWVAIGHPNPATGTVAVEQHLQAAGSYLMPLPTCPYGVLRVKWRANTGTGSAYIRGQKKK